MLCDDLEGWDGAWDGREVQEGGAYVYIWLIHVVVQQKLTWHSKAIILQLKLFFKEINYLPTTRNRGI